MERILEWLAKSLAIVGGLVVVAITLITTASIVGRWLFNSPLLGDTEIVEYGMAVVVACFLPICQWRGENIIVDFFTTRASVRTRDRLDRIGALLIAAMLGLIAWRTGVGALDQKRYGSVTMLLQWPDWYAYAMMSVPMAIAALMALYTAITGRNGAHAGPPTHNPVPESAAQQEP
jgi:TRAP-type C4-dicarboxylate transport system permease small subunit